jgi:hypothetical protein
VIHLEMITFGSRNPEEYMLKLAEKCLKLEGIVVTDYSTLNPKSTSLAVIVRDCLVPRLYHLEEVRGYLGAWW